MVNRIKALQYSNGVVQAYEYHPRGWVSQITISKDAKFFQESYSYDAVGKTGDYRRQCSDEFVL